ncbi:MAG: HAMP domain-containing sensor histidine kinase [Akkermansiaceae bacterium]|nr:HAMP domain-containing sensor histidine kinase [Akkermansiaceae bacterium]
MKSSWSIWLILIVCALAILGAMGWQTQRTLSLEKERIEAAAQAKLEERVRLALSRMDTAASAMLVIENQRPPEHYQAFYRPQAIYTNALQSVDGSLVTQPSPLLSDPPEFVKLHFEAWAFRDLSSPQVPTGNHRDLAEVTGIPSADIERHKQRLRRLRDLLNAPAPSELQGVVEPGQFRWEANYEAMTCDNFDVMAAVARDGQGGWGASPDLLPEVGQAWSNREVQEIVSNTYAQPEQQAYYQQELTRNDRGKRQQVYQQAQRQATNMAVPKYNKLKASASYSSDSNASQQDVKDEKVLDDAPSAPKPAKDSEKNNRMLINPGQSIAWNDSKQKEKRREQKPSAATSVPTAEIDGSLKKGDAVFSAAPEASFHADQQVSEDALAELGQSKAEDSFSMLEEAKDEEVSQATKIIDLEVTPFRPLWLNDELLVVRQVRSETGMRFQGFWVDAEALRASLLEGISDLLPNAELVPIQAMATTSLEEGFALDEPAMDDRTLVTLPWRLEEGIELDVALAGFTPLHTSLGIGWIAVLLAMVAAAMLVRGVMRMSERRAAFVSSVTHELRTPLTTFQLYSDLLAEGMVPEGEKRQSYLKTMRLEAGRLNHLIENVLSYSRIERGSARTQREKLSAASLVGRFEDRLANRAQRDQVRFEVNGLDEHGSAEVETDVTAVEQILFNLVDNACKYGVSEEEPGTIRLHVEADRKRVRLAICDSGNGIRRGDHRKLFRPFHKSAHDAAETKPGVGLGLSLCRRLARALGGNLTVDSKRDKGACFVLTLPRV